MRFKICRSAYLSKLEIRTETAAVAEVNEESKHLPLWSVSGVGSDLGDISSPFTRWEFKGFFFLFLPMIFGFEEMVCVSCA